MSITIRWIAISGAITSLALSLLAPGARAQDDAPPDLPDAFVSSASATALGIELVTPPLLPVEGLFSFGVADGRGSYESANQEARASVVFPGNGVVKGPGLVCGELGKGISPDDPVLGPVVAACLAFRFPLAVFADSLDPDAQTEGAVVLGERTDPVSLQAAGGRAHAGLDATTTDSEVNDLRVIGAPAVGSLDALLHALGLEPGDSSLVAVDGLTATTDQRIVDGALVTESRATVHGLRLLGGLVHVDSIVSRSAITSAPGAEAVVDSGIELAGVQVAGTPAQVTEDGLVLGSSPAGPLAQQILSEAAAYLQEIGLRMELLPTEEGDIDGVPFASATGLLIEFTTPVTGTPPVPGPLGDADLNGTYGVRLQLGTTGARGFADSFGDEAVSPVRPPSSPLSNGGSEPGVFSGNVTRSGAPSPASPSATPTAAGAVPVAQPRPAGVFSDLFAERLRFLYLSFTLAAVALCLAPKLTLPAR